MDLRIFLENLNSSFYTGVPDSQLKALCCYLADTFGISGQHIIAANEGNCTALAAGYYLATGKIPIVYMQNSGLGNVINPITSLAHREVYGIPMLFLIGWRGEPGVKDEPQHKFMGRLTAGILELLEIDYAVIDAGTTQKELEIILEKAQDNFSVNKQFAIVLDRLSFLKQNT